MAIFHGSWALVSEGSRHGSVAGVEHLLDRVVSNVEHGRFERALSGLTAAAAV